MSLQPNRVDDNIPGKLEAPARTRTMKTRWILAVWIALTGGLLSRAGAQILISAGTYQQNFDYLAASGTGNPWADNTTLPGWYAAKTANGSSVTTYSAGTGSANTGAMYSFGVAGVSNATDRALGSVASGTPGNFAYGVRFLNDTGTPATNLVVTVTGEQWRDGGNTSTQTLAFSYRISATPIINADAGNANPWISLPALDFATPVATATAGALDGNLAANRQILAGVALTGVGVPPGHEVFLRWSDPNDSGNDHGLALDELVVTFNTGTSNPPSAPQLVTPPVSRNAVAGETVQFSVVASGNPAPVYQWRFNGSPLATATNATLTLFDVTANDAGSYQVTVTNSQEAVTSAPVTLTISPAAAGVSVLTYNVKGNGATDWTTNAPQVQAIARQLQHLDPDIITFNEIPFEYRNEMTNFVAAFLPGYQLAVSSGTDGAIVSAIASRYPILRASKWLDGIDLRSFGYSNANNALDNFTRDLYEAEIDVAGFPRPLHVFTTHLKATSGTTYEDAAAKRAAEAAAITNFFATNLLTLYPYDPYVLTGDMNDSDPNSLAIQKLVSAPTGLHLTDPRHPTTGSINTFSTANANPSSRLDYLFPGPLLQANLQTGQVFRSSLVNPLPPGLNAADSQVASDHYPVLLVFNNPYDRPFEIRSVTRTNTTVTLRWESVFGQPYRVESSSNLVTWATLADNLVATGTNHVYSTNLPAPGQFFRVYRIP
jgi:endonuclease/exonuclease/phosphatase family metal-dependent hydrolase